MSSTDIAVGQVPIKALDLLYKVLIRYLVRFLQAIAHENLCTLATSYLNMVCRQNMMHSMKVPHDAVYYLW